MNFSLRNLALAAVVTVAGSVVAQEAVVPTVTKKWSFENLAGPDKNDSRFGTGFNGKVYYNDKANKKIVAIDETGASTDYAAVEGLGTGISSDDAGNILVNLGFPNASSGANFLIVAPDGTQTPLTLTMPEGVTAGRVDQVGRVVGNLLSEEGAFFFLGENGATSIVLVQVKNGVQVTDELAYYATEALAAPTFNTSAVVNPTLSFQEMVDMGDDCINTFAARNRITKNVYYYNVDGEYTTMGAVAGANTQEGFDVFMLGDVLYQAAPIKGKSAANYSAEFSIADEAGNVIYTDEMEGGDGSQSFGSFCAHKVADNKVELYYYFVSGKGITAAMYEIALPGDEPAPVAPLYLAGDVQGWDPANAIELTAVDGKYTYTFAQGADKGFKISTVKGSWDEFNAGVLGASEDNTTLTLTVNEPVTLEAGKLGNLAAPGPGDWTITIDAETKQLVLTGEPDRVEVASLYAAGAFQGWNPEAAAAFVKGEDGLFTLDVTDAEGQFKLSMNQGPWDGEGSFNAGLIGVNSDTNLVEGEAVTLVLGGNNNIVFPAKGNWTLTFNPADMTLVCNGKAAELELPLYVFVRGEMTEWAADWSYALTPKFDIDAPVANENGEYEYSLYLDYFFGDFKLADNTAEYTWNFGAKGEDPVIAAGKTNEAWFDSSENFKLEGKQYTEAQFTFYYNPDHSKASWLKFDGVEYVEPTPAADRAHFAYNLSSEKGENNTYTIKFHATGDAPKAVLVLTDKETGNEVEHELGAVVKGENTFTYDANALPGDKAHTWAIRLHTGAIAEPIITEPVNVGGNRAGLVVFTDPEYPEVFGKVAIGRTKNSGIEVYNAEGVLETTVHAGNAMFGAAANNSCPMDGKQRGTEAVFASWGDAAYGVVAVDIANLDAEPYSVFEGVKQPNGTVMNGDVAVGSGTPCVAFSGEGENTLMYTFDEDIFGNHLTVSRIGNNKTVGTALEDLGFASKLANTNVAMWGTKTGLWLSQIRANGMEPGVTGLAYYDNNFMDITWQASDMAETDPAFLPSAAAGVCVNPAGDLLAVATYTGVEVYLLSWNEDGTTPILEKYMTVASPYAAGNRTNIQFDAANNIHVVNQSNGYYRITLPEEEPIALTAAQTNPAYEIQNTTGVENIAVEGGEVADAVYYNLNGVRVAADALVPGVYVKVVGKTATKVVVK